jgi:DNA (cytosine-5)-methyltransferase 1
MSRPRLLVLFCGAGGCDKGYEEAGFQCVGVDIEPMPNYCGSEFIQADALEVLRTLIDEGEVGGYKMEDFDGAHASPPCQNSSSLKNLHRDREHPELIPPTRELLLESGLPYVMENVEGAPLVDPVVICGSMFEPPMDIRRHRLFETNWDLEPPMWPCRHKMQGGPRFPGGRSKERTGSSRGLVRATMEIGSWDIPLADQKQAMGIDWDVTLPELSNAIPPAYTRFIGEQLTHHLKSPDNELEEVA